MVNDVLILFIAFCGSFCFGLTGVIIKLGVENQNVLFGLIVRVLGSAPFQLILNLVLFGPAFFIAFLPIDIISLVFLSSLLMILSDLLLMHALKSKPVGVIIPISAMNPLFTTIFLLITGEEIISLEIILLTFLIIMGILMVTYEQPDDMRTSINQIIDVQALVVGLTIAFLWGLMTYIEITILKREDIVGISYSAMKIFGLGLIGSLAIFLTGTSTAELRISFSRKTSVKYLLIAGFVGWVLGSVLVYSSFDLGPAAIINLIVGMSPIFAVILSIAIRMEKFSRIKFLGILICIFSSIFLVI